MIRRAPGADPAVYGPVVNHQLAGNAVVRKAMFQTVCEFQANLRFITGTLLRLR